MGGDDREQRKLEREFTVRGEVVVVEMHRSQRENKTEGVTPPIASSGAVASFIFTHYEAFFVVLAFSDFTTEDRASLQGVVWLMKALNIGSETLEGFLKKIDHL